MMVAEAAVGLHVPLESCYVHGKPNGFLVDCEDRLGLDSTYLTGKRVYIAYRTSGVTFEYKRHELPFYHG